MSYTPNSKHKRNFQMAQWFYEGKEQWFYHGKELLGKHSPQRVGGGE